MFSFFGCGKKKAASNEVDQWLENNFPQQFEIIENKYAVNTWTSLDRSKFKLVLADKGDKDVQFTIHWNTTLQDGGTSINEVKQSLESARIDAENARTLIDILKKNGFHKTSVGITEAREGYVADILFYENLLPAERTNWFNKIKNALNESKLSHNSHYCFGIMDSVYFGKDFETIIPSRFIHEWTEGKRDYCIFSAEMQWSDDLIISDFQWEVNLNSQRALIEYNNDAFKQADTWAKTNSQKTIYLRNNGITTEANAKDPFAIDICIPYFLTAEAASTEMQHDEKIPGYVCGTYFVDEKKLKGMKLKR